MIAWAEELLEARRLVAPLPLNVEVASGSVAGNAKLEISPSELNLIARVYTIEVFRRGESIWEDYDERGSLIGLNSPRRIEFSYDPQDHRGPVIVAIRGQRLGGPTMMLEVPFHVVEDGRLERLDALHPFIAFG